MSSKFAVIFVKSSLTLLIASLCICGTNSSTEDEEWNVNSEDLAGESPTILLSIIARNEEKTLPTYLAYIERQYYPKSQISILIQTDHNEDKTEQRLKEWIKHANLMYRKIKIVANSSDKVYSDASGPNEWSPARYKRLAGLRQLALEYAREQGVDYLMFVDTDNFLMNPNTINALIAQEKTVVAPMIRTFDNDTTYSNYWCGMDESGYYKRTPDYFPILYREKKGCFDVPMVHSTYLIDLRQKITDNLYYLPDKDYTGELDDILVFAYSARMAGIMLYILNSDDYGRMLAPATGKMSVEDDAVAFVDAAVDWMAYHKPLISTNLTNHRPPPIDNMGFDEIYMVNLARRPDRRKRMLMTLEELGMYANEQDAVDGRKLKKEMLDQMGIFPMMDFKDPYLERPITMGEVGCFLSHWNIWKDVIENQLETVLVIEDDIRFEPDFKRKMKNLLLEARELLWRQDWDLMKGKRAVVSKPALRLFSEHVRIKYIGRKRMSTTQEERVEGTKNLVWARYSYWTLAYILRLSGAEKLIAGEPLKQMIPVDEYIPILFNDHTDAELMSKFPTRNLLALSAHPLLVFPTHYVGDKGYISDTEATHTVFKSAAEDANVTDNGTIANQDEITDRRIKQKRITSQLQGDL